MVQLLKGQKKKEKKKKKKKKVDDEEGRGYDPWKRGGPWAKPHRGGGEPSLRRRRDCIYGKGRNFSHGRGKLVDCFHVLDNDEQS
jgi:hypothetical protein